MTILRAIKHLFIHDWHEYSTDGLMYWSHHRECRICPAHQSLIFKETAPNGIISIANRIYPYWRAVPRPPPPEGCLHVNDGEKL